MREQINDVGEKKRHVKEYIDGSAYLDFPLQHPPICQSCLLAGSCGHEFSRWVSVDCVGNPLHGAVAYFVYLPKTMILQMIGDMCSAHLSHAHRYAFTGLIRWRTLSSKPSF